MNWVTFFLIIGSGCAVYLFIATSFKAMVYQSKTYRSDAVIAVVGLLCLALAGGLAL